jgi:hypothetical protein
VAPARPHHCRVRLVVTRATQTLHGAHRSWLKTGAVYRCPFELANASNARWESTSIKARWLRCTLRPTVPLGV